MSKRLLVILSVLSVVLLVFSGGSTAYLSQNSGMMVVPDTISLDADSTNMVTVDGIIGADWSDGNYTSTNGYFEGDTGITNLYTALTADGVYVGLNTTQSHDTAWQIFVDHNSSIGVSTASARGDWSRNIDFAPGFTADKLITTYGYGTPMQMWDMTSGASNIYWYEVPNTSTLQSNSSGVLEVHYEFLIPMNVIMQDKPFEAGKEIKIVAVNAGTGSDPNLVHSVPSSVSLDQPLLVNNWLTLNLDYDNNAVPDYESYFPLTGFIYDTWNLAGVGDNSIQGNLQIADVLEVNGSYYLNANQDSVHVKDHPNHLDVLTLNYRVLNNDTEVWGDMMSTPMIHLPGASWSDDANWDKYTGQIDTSVFNSNDTIEYFVTNPGGLESSKVNITLTGEPPVYVPPPEFEGIVDLDGNLEDWTAITSVVMQGELEFNPSLVSLNIAVDENGLYVGLIADQFDLGQNGWLVFLDVDGDTSGSTTLQTASAFARNVTFAEGFQPNLMLASWQQNDPAFHLWGLGDDNTRSWMDNVGHEASGAAQSGTTYHYESFISWSTIYGDAGFPATGAQLQVGAGLFGPDWTEADDFIPAADGDNATVMDHYYIIDMDSNADGVADLDAPNLTLGPVVEEPTDSTTPETPSSQGLSLPFETLGLLGILVIPMLRRKD